MAERVKVAPLWTRDFLLICFANLAIFMGFQMLIPTLPLYVDYLGGDDAVTGLVIGIFTVSAVLMRPFVGRALDTYGRKILYVGGLVVFFIAVICYNFTPTVFALLAVRLLHGAGWGAASTSAGTIATDVVPKQRMAEGLGYYGLANTLSMAVAPMIGLYIISKASFTVLFSVSALCSAAAIVLGSLIRHNKVEGSGKRGDLLEKSAFRPAVVMLLIASTFGAIGTFIALYANELGIGNIGPFFTVYAFTLAVTRPTSGRLADRKGYNTVVIPGIIFIAVAVIFLAQANALWMFLVAGVFYGAGFGSVAPAMQALVVRNVAPNRRGAANGTYFSSFDLGIGIGSVLWGYIASITSYAAMYLFTLVPIMLALVTYIFFSGREEVKEVKKTGGRIVG